MPVMKWFDGSAVRRSALLVGVMFTVLLTACSKEELQPVTLDLEVHKTPTCGCCTDWVVHMRDSGFNVTAHDHDDLNPIKQKLNIEPANQSCHTAVTRSGEYFFEGHVPAPIVRAFLSDPPAQAIGLAVPGMPVGSPGMEVDDRFQPYQVYQVNRDGSREVYKQVDSPDEQYNH